MSYQITYKDGKACQQALPRKRNGRWLTIIVCAILLLGLWQWPKGRAVMEEMIWPGGVAQVHAAFETMSQNLQNGVPLTQAAECFCREIIAGGEVE